MTIHFIPWLQENKSRIDWQIFAEPWDAMQRKHNPFPDDQVDTILRASSVLDLPTPQILDLGCGPGILGKHLIRIRPQTQYFGADGDPLMLAALQSLLPDANVHPLHIDLRKPSWMLQYQGKFDSVVSLTALHWLSKDHLKQLFKAIHEVLKPGGRLVIGDPYLPNNESDRFRLKAFQDERISVEKGSTWNEFWDSFFEMYPVRDAYTNYHISLGYQEPFEGSDEGYPLSFYEGSLAEAGFHPVTIFWMSGLRVVYGGTKRFP
jgi:SAM-dependent methyltransferase